LRVLIAPDDLFCQRAAASRTQTSAASSDAAAGGAPTVAVAIVSAVGTFRRAGCKPQTQHHHSNNRSPPAMPEYLIRVYQTQLLQGYADVMLNEASAEAAASVVLDAANGDPDDVTDCLTDVPSRWTRRIPSSAAASSATSSTGMENCSARSAICSLAMPGMTFGRQRARRSCG
jgi:hypothetical protein